jgi:amino-acid N-acetyltransferase
MTGDSAADRVRPVVRSAAPSDLPTVLSLLEASDLPADGVEEWLDHFRVAEWDGAVVGVAGMELYEDGALLRSVVVSESLNGRGVGGLLVEDMLGRARAAGVSAVWLLTTTAAGWFPRYGFRVTDRSLAPAGVAGSVEFRSACPASAVAMVLDGTALVSRGTPA